MQNSDDKHSIWCLIELAKLTFFFVDDASFPFQIQIQGKSPSQENAAETELR